MKTRVIQTRFWDDEFVIEASKLSKYLYIYILTSQYINICGIFQLHDKKIMMESGLTPMELETAKEDLTKARKVFFKDGWVWVVNAEKNNRYRNSDKNEVAYQREMGVVPKAIKEFFDSSIDSSIDTSMDTTHKSKIINNKSKTINTNTKEEWGSPSYFLSLKDNEEELRDLTNRFMCTERDVVKKAMDFYDYCTSKGKTYKDYKAALSSALSKDFGRREIPVPKVTVEYDKYGNVIGGGKK